MAFHCSWNKGQIWCSIRVMCRIYPQNYMWQSVNQINYCYFFNMHLFFRVNETNTWIHAAVSERGTNMHLARANVSYHTAVQAWICWGEFNPSKNCFGCFHSIWNEEAINFWQVVDTSNSWTDLEVWGSSLACSVAYLVKKLYSTLSLFIQV